MSLQYFKQHIFPVKDKLYRFAYRLLGNAMDAEDVVQEVFLKIWKKQEEWASIENMDAWCMTMAKKYEHRQIAQQQAICRGEYRNSGRKAQRPGHPPGKRHSGRFVVSFKESYGQFTRQVQDGNTPAGYRGIELRRNRRYHANTPEPSENQPVQSQKRHQTNNA